MDKLNSSTTSTKRLESLVLDDESVSLDDDTTSEASDTLPVSSDEEFHPSQFDVAHSASMTSTTTMDRNGSEDGHVDKDSDSGSSGNGVKSEEQAAEEMMAEMVEDMQLELDNHQPAPQSSYSSNSGPSCNRHYGCNKPRGHVGRCKIEDMEESSAQQLQLQFPSSSAFVVKQEESVSPRSSAMAIVPP